MFKHLSYIYAAIYCVQLCETVNKNFMNNFFQLIFKLKMFIKIEGKNKYIEKPMK